MKSNPKILIVDDDERLVEAMQRYLSAHGYNVQKTGTGLEGLEMVDKHQPALVILDIMLPQVDGWEVCSLLRMRSDVPIIMVTARGQEADRVRGLQLGADDYVSKPFSLMELEARIQAVLRRANLNTPNSLPIVYEDEVLRIEVDAWLVHRYGEPLDLTATERRLLFLLVENADRTVSTELILERIWGEEYTSQTEYVKLYVWRLRRKLELDPGHPRYVVTERGIGYRFVSQV